MSDIDRLYHDAELVQFYDAQNPWGEFDDMSYCKNMATDAGSVLDMGCGTGQFLAGIAEGRLNVGVDPASAMLDVARARPNGDQVSWVEGDARTIRLGQKFDLIVLTGHAFQVFLTDDDRRAVLTTIAEHLKPDGKFIFDSRNPLREAWREWMESGLQSKWTVNHPELGAVEAWSDASQDALSGVLTYETHYRIEATGQVLSAASQIAFPAKEVLAQLIRNVGLSVDRWLGDWQGGTYSEASKEIIPIGRLK
ncbi:MAG: class I SAM-dependent methyltransferase [Rhodospirillales bacterium]|jgi:SAM-dependent methyltransferase|nr:class I SAM-dependent methyltransferase [Rhodospirillales bacterium]MBT4041536.1 class I SAM-dependent methyltransferase [Rhodospirillales bacterium]MBT4627154.1 class I SAM-dependent methyltransferase [Rhodospirillales bacterium]MBT5351343.1 class I SAM-dependent methyltransferase [Rhodospirillales bacterium]MBT5519286.1 class I SAM-dependent methyltransferase [Rhodospirillales bacterium]